MSATTTLTIEVPVAIGDQLEQLAQALSRSKNWLAQEALRYFLDLQEWQLQAIKKGIDDAEAGRLVDHEGVAAWLESWGTAEELPPPTCD